MTVSADLPFAFNLMTDRSVVTREGEYLGTWGKDESDAFYQFTPDGSSEVLFEARYIGLLCEEIEQWQGAQLPDTASDD